MQVASLVSGVQKGLTLGEAPVTLVTPNLQLMIASALVSETGNSVLTTPPTEKQTAYESIQPKITLGPQGLSACASAPSSNYAEFSLVQWGINPHATSLPIQSTMMRFSSVSPAYTPPSAMTQRNVQRKSIVFPVHGIPAYTIALQFTTVQQFNFTAGMDYSAKSRSTPNFTLPACTQYDGTKYVPCKSCNISSYTNYNVTYSCYDIEQLCPRASTRRRLSEGEQYVSDLGYHSDLDWYDFNNDDEDMNEIEEMYEDEYEGEGEGEDEEMNKDQSGRTAIDISDVEEDTIHGYQRILQTADDDSVKGNTMPTSSTFGVILESVDAQLTTVLSSNPFALQASENIAILSLVSCLSGGILIMLVILRRLDNKTKVKNKIAKQAKEDMRKLLFQAEIAEKIPVGPDEPYDRRQEFQRSKFDANGTKSYMNSNFSRKYFSTYGTSCKKLSTESSPQSRSSPRNYFPTFGASCKKLSTESSPVSPSSPHSKASASLQDGSDADESEENDLDSDELTPGTCYLDDKRLATSAVVEEFLHKVFSGRSIFKKDWNAWRIICANHMYFNSIGTPTVRSSRVIRFLGLMSQIMIILLLDTLFFGIFYPRAAPCTLTTDKVMSSMTD